MGERRAKAGMGADRDTDERVFMRQQHDENANDRNNRQQDIE
jgi:hypothetical protein